MISKVFINIPKLLLLISFALVAMTLAGCADREIAEEKNKDARIEADGAIEKIRGYYQPRPSLLVEDSPWFGARAIPFQNGDPLPIDLEKDDSIVITFDRPLTIEQVAARIQGATGMRIIVGKERGKSDGSGSIDDQTGAGEALFLPVDGRLVSGGRVLWQGSLSSILDQIADRFDAEWRYNGKVINLSQHIVRTFMLHSLAGTTEIESSVNAGDSEGGTLPTQGVSSTAELEIWDEIERTVDNIIGNEARASYSPATGTITIAGSPSAINSAQEYLQIQNELRLRRVVIEARVLAVTLNKGYDFDFDLELVFENIIEDQPFVFTSKGLLDNGAIQSGLVRTIPTELGSGDSQSLVINSLDALAEDVSVVHSGTVMTLSDQPAPLQVATKRSYIERVTGSAAEGTSSTTLEPGTIDVGLTMNVLPRVIEQDQVMLRIALGITDLVELREVSTDDSTIQLPEIDTTGFLQNIVMRSGETLVMAGFERNNSSTSDRGVGHPLNFLLGSDNSWSHSRRLRVLLLTTNILPSKPIDIVYR